jgi:hypothetical protein
VVELNESSAVGTVCTACPNAPNPHDVAEAIAQVVEQPNGTRPARLVVGQSFGADAINAQAVSIEAQLMEGLGLEQLAEPRMGSAAA